MTKRTQHTALVVAAMIITALSRVKLPKLEPFSDALAGIGLGLGLWANKQELMRKKAPGVLTDTSEAPTPNPPNV